MQKIKTVTVMLTADIHKDFRWATRIMGQNVQEAGSTALEHYIATVKKFLATTAKRETGRDADA